MTRRCRWSTTGCDRASDSMWLINDSMWLISWRCVTLIQWLAWLGSRDSRDARASSDSLTHARKEKNWLPLQKQALTARVTETTFQRWVSPEASYIIIISRTSPNPQASRIPFGELSLFCVHWRWTASQELEIHARTWRFWGHVKDTCRSLWTTFECISMIFMRCTFSLSFTVWCRTDHNKIRRLWVCDCKDMFFCFSFLHLKPSVVNKTRLMRFTP